MEMPEKQLRDESVHLLGTILSNVLKDDNETPFTELLEKIDGIKDCAECLLERADQRIIRLLHNQANTQH